MAGPSLNLLEPRNQDLQRGSERIQGQHDRTPGHRTVDGSKVPGTNRKVAHLMN